MFEHSNAIHTDLVGEKVKYKKVAGQFIIRAITVAQNHGTEDLSCVVQDERTGDLSTTWISTLSVLPKPTESSC